ncbi:MAG: cell division protein FtsZ [Bacteroidales bacterium]
MTDNNAIDSLIDFEVPTVSGDNIITVIGIGGAGNNTVNNLYRRGVKGISFVNCNTDAQVLSVSPVPVKILLGEKLTHGKGAGDNVAIGEKAAEESESEIRAVLSDGTKMVFLTAGMGGGTGTSASRVIARIAREMGILTVAVVSFPAHLEGRKRFAQAYDGLLQLQECVDSLLVLKNDKLYTIFSDLPASQAFKKADDIIAMAVKGTAEIVSLHGGINIDFADVNTVLRNSRVFVMGSGYSEGEARVAKAVKEALESPLLADNTIHGAEYILVNMMYGNSEFRISEIGSIMKSLQNMSSNNAEIIHGTMHDDSLGDKIGVTIVASGFANRVKVLDEFDKNKAVETDSKAASSKSYSTTVKSEYNKELVDVYNDQIVEQDEADKFTEPIAVVEDKQVISEPQMSVNEFLDKNTTISLEDIFNEEKERADFEDAVRNEERLNKLNEEKLLQQEIYAEKLKKERKEREQKREEEEQLKEKQRHLNEVQCKKKEEYRKKQAEEKRTAKQKRTEERKRNFREKEENGIEAGFAKMTNISSFFNDENDE